MARLSPIVATTTEASAAMIATIVMARRRRTGTMILIPARGRGWAVIGVPRADARESWPNRLSDRCRARAGRPLDHLEEQVPKEERAEDRQRGDHARAC